MLGNFDFNFDNQTSLCGVITAPLYNGCIYVGQQEASDRSFDVKVQIQFIDNQKEILSGYLNIDQFNSDKSSLTTYFEGEIISESCPFLTNKWQSTISVDEDHWKKFSFLKNRNDLFRSTFDYNIIKNSKYIFMRWKEKCGVSNSTINDNRIAGFYYIALNKDDFTIEGYYYCPKSQRHKLNLRLKKELTNPVFAFS